MKLRKLFFILCLSIQPFFVMGDGLTENKVYKAERGLSLDISREGFQLLSQVAQEKFLNGLRNRKIKDVNVELPLIAKASVEGISYSAEFESVNLVPYSSGLELEVKIKNIHVNISHIRFQNFFVPAIGTSCYNTSVDLGNYHTLPIHAKLGTKLENKKFKLQSDAFSLKLNKYQYLTAGPQECKGVFGLKDFITQFVMREVLAHARPFINLGIKFSIKKLIGRMEGMVNKTIANKKFPVNIPDLSVVPGGSKLLIGMTPEFLDISNDGLRIIVSLDFQNVPKTDFLAIEEEEENAPGPELMGDASGVRFLTLGVKTDLINNLVKAILPNGSPEIEITPDLNEMVADILNTGEIANFLPDLEEAELDSEDMRLFVKIVKAPEILLSEDGPTLSLPDLAMKFMVKKDGDWMDYYTMHLNLRLSFALNLDKGMLALQLEPKSLKMSGEWAENYTASNPTFNKEDAEETFLFMVKMLTSDPEKPLALPVPILPLGKKSVTIDNIKVENSYIKLDVVEATLN